MEREQTDVMEEDGEGVDAGLIFRCSKWVIIPCFTTVFTDACCRCSQAFHYGCLEGIDGSDDKNGREFWESWVQMYRWSGDCDDCFASTEKDLKLDKITR